MPLAVFRSEDIVPMGESLSIDDRQGILVGVNSSGTIRVRFEDSGEDEEVEPSDASLNVGPCNG